MLNAIIIIPDLITLNTKVPPPWQNKHVCEMNNEQSEDSVVERVLSIIIIYIIVIIIIIRFSYSKSNF